MPAWPGGPCPACGEETPANLIRCRNCRTLLNSDLIPSDIVTPEFVPLEELDSCSELACRGFYMNCPGCQREIKLNRRFEGRQVVCKHCQDPFRFDMSDAATSIVAMYVDCPHCTKRLRLPSKYDGQKVSCKHCQEQLIVRSRESTPESPETPV